MQLRFNGRGPERDPVGTIWIPGNLVPLAVAALATMVIASAHATDLKGIYEKKEGLLAPDPAPGTARRRCRSSAPVGREARVARSRALSGNEPRRLRGRAFRPEPETSANQGFERVGELFFQPPFRLILQLE